MMNGEDDRDFTQEENALFDKLEAVINKTAKEVCADHIATGTEEPALTSRIAQAIQTELKHHPLQAGDVHVQVDSHDIPSHGPGALERKSGVDLYVSVIRDDGDQMISKGIILQSKQVRALGRDHKKLRNQANRMKYRSDESYVVIFDRDDAVAVPAQRATYPKLPDDFRRDQMTVGRLISDGFRCRKGDPEIGMDAEKSRTEAMAEVMEKLRARRALSLSMIRKRSTSRRR